MDNPLSAASTYWLDVFSAAVLGSVLIVGLAAAGQGLLRAAVWQRAIWQVAMAALVVFAAAQWLGLSAAADRLVEMAFLPTSDAAESSHPASRTARAPASEPPGLEPREAASPREPRPPAASGPMAGRDWWAVSPASPDVVPGPGRVWWPPALWLLGSAVVGLRIAWSRWTLARFRRRHAALESETWGQGAQGLADRLGIRGPVTLLEVPGLDAPVAFGLFRRTVAVPAHFARGPLDKERQSVLAHELAHLASGDPFWQLLGEVACAAWWWQPWVWWARRRLREASEAAADEASLLVPGGPDALAECLVALGRQQAERRWGWLAFRGTRFRSSLGQRVERLLGLAARPHGRPAPPCLPMVQGALCGVLATLSILVTALAAPRAAGQTGETTRGVLQSAWQGSLATAALTAWLGPDPAPAAAHDTPQPEAKPVEERRPPPQPEPQPRPQPAPGPAPGAAVVGKAPPPDAARFTTEEAKQVARRYLLELEVRFDELSQAGKHAEAARVAQEIAHIRKRIEVPPESPPQPGQPLSPAERERRVGYLRAAAENLLAAGMNREAESFTRLADRLEEGGPMPPSRWMPEEKLLMAGQGAAAPETGTSGPPAGPRPESLDPAVRELREQIFDLRRQLEELRQRVQREHAPKDGK